MSNFQPVFKIVGSHESLQKAFIVRGIVFVEEQNCPYTEEYDKFDYSATHFLGEINDEPVAAARIRWYKGNIKFERLAVRKEYRNIGLGKAFFEFVLGHMEQLGSEKIVMHAQRYITGFYDQYGFEKKGDVFMEAGIEHYCMEKRLK